MVVIKMTILKTIGQTLGLAGALAAVGCRRSEESQVTRNPRVSVTQTCRIENTVWHRPKVPVHHPNEITTTIAVDTTGDGQLDEAFTTKGWYNLNLGVYQTDNQAVRATTHYVASGLTPDRQMYTGFPNTQLLTEDYQRGLQMACKGSGNYVTTRSSPAEEEK